MTVAKAGLEGEARRGVTWVRVKWVRSGQCGIGGNVPSADDRRWPRAERETVGAGPITGSAPLPSSQLASKNEAAAVYP